MSTNIIKIDSGVLYNESCKILNKAVISTISCLCKDDFNKLAAKYNLIKDKEEIKTILKNLSQRNIDNTKKYLLQDKKLSNEQSVALENLYQKFSILSSDIIDNKLSMEITEISDSISLEESFAREIIVLLCAYKSFSEFHDWWISHPTSSSIRMYVIIFHFFHIFFSSNPEFKNRYNRWRRKKVIEKWEEEFITYFKELLAVIYYNEDKSYVNELGEVAVDNSYDLNDLYYWCYFLFFERKFGVFNNLIHLLIYCASSRDVPTFLKDISNVIIFILIQNPRNAIILQQRYNMQTGNLDYFFNEYSGKNIVQVNLLNEGENLEHYNLNENKDSLSNSVIASEKEFYNLSYDLANKVYDFLSDNEVFKVDNIDLTNFILFIQSADFKYLGNKEIKEIVKKNIFGRTCCSIKDYVILGDDDIKAGWLNKVASQLYPNTQKKPIYLCKSPSNPSKEKVDRLDALEKEMKKEYNKITLNTMRGK